MTTALSTLVQRVSEGTGDWIEVAVTTNIANDTSVISTNLRAYDHGVDDYFNNWYVYITNLNNADVERKISDYATATGTCTVWGDSLTADSSAATIQLSRYKRTDKENAINDAIRDLAFGIWKHVESSSLITGNILPPFIWSSSTALDLYTENTGGIVQTTTGGLFRHGPDSAKVTASGADDYLYISSNDFPRLLNAMDETIHFKCWVYPEVADDAFLTIYTVQPDGTAQTLNSTTSCPASKWSLLELEDQTLNDDLHEVQFRMRVHTDTKYAYFDPPRVIQPAVREYILPNDFQNGKVAQVYIQTSGYSDDICDDLHPVRYERIYDYSIINDGTYRYLRLESAYTNNRRIRLIGTTPLSSLSSATDTIPFDEGDETRLIVNYASSLLYERAAGTVSSEDRLKFKEEREDWRQNYRRIQGRMRMTPPSGTLRV